MRSGVETRPNGSYCSTAPARPGTTRPAASKSALTTWAPPHGHTEPAGNVLNIGGWVLRDPAEHEHVQVTQEPLSVRHHHAGSRAVTARS